MQSTKGLFLDRYLIQWVGRCTYDTSDKVWGWFYHLDFEQDPNRFDRTKHKYCYVFWGATGKTMSFKKNYTHAMTKLRQKKTSNHYQEISLDTFSSFWPDIKSSWNDRFILYLLSNTAE
jgi:hypothetical protein